MIPPSNRPPRPAAKRFKRSLDQHFRELTRREREIVLWAQSRCRAFLLYESREENMRRLQVERLDGMTAVHIGRNTDNDIVISWDQRVSGTHAKLLSEAGSWFVEDLQSKNGTFIGAERIIERRRLQDGDKVDLARGRAVPILEFNAIEQERSTVSADDRDRPRLTPSEERLVAAVCLHRLCGTGEEPATDREMSQVLRMQAQSIRKALTPVFEKFNLTGAPQGRKRAELAIEHGCTRREHLPVDCQEIARRLGDA